MADMGPQIQDLGPWSMAEQFGTEPEASWGPPEVLAHVSEMLPYWLGEIERIVAAQRSSDPVPFGRVSGDAVRIAIIGRDRTVPIPELLARISADARRVGARLRALDAQGQADRVGLHPRIGEMTVADAAERFLATHGSEHVLQLREILAAARA
ncbi:MAG TPA: DinB family protein [Candidatus Limnocylindrales bacterium]|nr:DinB family protein [Candidatus Limnocylindrales bacterium]